MSSAQITGGPVDTPVQKNPPQSIDANVAAYLHHWPWLVGLGLAFVIAGMVALGAVVPATIASVYVVGFLMLMAGFAEVFSAFQMKSWKEFILWMLLGALYIAAGILAFTNPVLTASTLTLLLGAALIAGGIVRGWLAFKMKDTKGWGWVLFSGAMTLLLGVMILAQWPVSSLYILGIFLGIDLMFAGFGWMAVGLTARKLAKSA